MDHLVCFLIFFFSLIPIQLFVEAKINGFTIDLIHRNSRLSPFYNKTATPEDLARNDALRPIVRSNYFSQSSKNIYSFDENKFESTVNANFSDYVMKISIGTPPVEIRAILDTGSDLVWTHCLNSSQRYNPMESSTYKRFSCSSESCKKLGVEKWCGSTKECEYTYDYNDGTNTAGVLSTDTFSLETTDGQPASFPNFVFGCDNNMGKYTENGGSGVVGLGRGPLSLVLQLGDQIEHKFSYCLQPFGASAPSKLRFGTNAVISGQSVVSTPLVPSSKMSSSNPTFYYLTLEAVSIGNNTIQNGNLIHFGVGYTVIDSGATLTRLEPIFYDDVERAVKDAVGLNPVNPPNETYKLCYDSESSKNQISSLTMVFHFTGADVTLKEVNLFRVRGDMTCLAIIPNQENNEKSSILGNVAQINFGVEYDLAKNKVSFVPAECTGF